MEAAANYYGNVEWDADKKSRIGTHSTCAPPLHLCLSADSKPCEI